MLITCLARTNYSRTHGRRNLHMQISSVDYTYEFHYEGPISLKFTCLSQSRTEFNFLLLNGIILTNYLKITHKME